MKSWALVLALCSTSPLSSGADILMIGLGSSTCGQFSEAVRKNDDLQVALYLNWAAGYTVGIERAYEISVVPSKLGDKWLETATTWFRTYCDQRPFEPFWQATNQFTTEILSRPLPLRRAK